MSMNISGLGNTYNGINTNSKQYKALKEKGWLSGIMQNEAMMLSLIHIYIRRLVKKAAMRTDSLMH